MRQWMVYAEGVDTTVVVEAPVEVDGWSERPWVRLRALTEAEALERESLGLAEEYELVSGGLQEPAMRVRRTYDLRAMAEYDYEHCVVELCLPEVQADGGVVEQRFEGAMNRAATDRIDFLGRMQPALAEWLHGEIERVNRRRPEQRAEIELVKKKLRELGRQEGGLSFSLAEVLRGELPEPAVRLREGVDFTQAAEAEALLAEIGAGASAGSASSRKPLPQVVRVPAWAMAVMRVLRELRMHEATGELPGGLPYSGQLAWKVELWEAYWDGRTAGRQDGRLGGREDERTAGDSEGQGVRALEAGRDESQLPALRYRSHRLRTRAVMPQPKAGGMTSVQERGQSPADRLRRSSGDRPLGCEPVGEDVVEEGEYAASSRRGAAGISLRGGGAIGGRRGVGVFSPRGLSVGGLRIAERTGDGDSPHRTTERASTEFEAKLPSRRSVSFEPSTVGGTRRYAGGDMPERVDAAVVRSQRWDGYERRRRAEFDEDGDVRLELSR